MGEVSIPQATFPAVTSHAVKHGVAVPPPLMPTLQMYKIYFQITTLQFKSVFRYKVTWICLTLSLGGVAVGQSRA